MERSFQDRSSVLGLAAVSREALLCSEAATRSRFRVLFAVSCGEGHEALLCAVWLLCGWCEGKRAPKGERRASSSSQTPSFLLSFPGHLRYIYGLAVAHAHTIFYKPRGTWGGR